MPLGVGPLARLTRTPKAAALLLLALVPFLGLLTDSVPVVHDIFVSDLLHAGLPYRAFIGQSLREGHFPLWMPGSFSGVPLLPQIEAGALYPPHLLLFFLFEPFRALNLALLLDIVIAASGAYALARASGRSTLAAVFAGVAFGASGFFVSHIRHPNMHAAAAWLPWLLWAQGRVLRSSGRAGGPLLALLFGLEVAAGHPQIAYYAGLILVLHGAWGLRSVERRGRTAAALVAALALGGCLLAALLLPTAAFTRESLAAVEPSWQSASAYPFRWADLGVLIWPPAVGSMETYDYAGVGSLPWGNYGFAGSLSLLLAALGLGAVVTSQRGERAWALGWAGAALLAMCLTLGALTPLYHLLWQWLPGMKLFRFPNRWLMLWILAIAQLAASGVDVVLERLPKRLAPNRRALGALLAVLLVGELSWHHRLRLPLDDAQSWRTPSALMQRIQRGRAWTLHELELWEVAFHQAKGATLGSAPYRIPWSAPIGSSGQLFGVSSASGYTRMVHQRTASFWQLYNHAWLSDVFQPELPTAESPELSAPLRSLLDRAGVRWIVSPHPLVGEGLIFEGASDYGLYQNTAAMPRAYRVTSWQSASSFQDSAARMLASTQPELPVVEDITAQQGQAPWQSVALQELSPQHLRLTLEPAPAGLVIFAESYDVGWSATVDGEPARILHANGWQQAVQIPAGAQVVELRYWPEGLSLGLVVSLLAGLGIGGWGVVGWRCVGLDCP